MKLKTFTFLKHKTYIFSFIVLMLGSILSAFPAFSQVDYYYGINKKGVRLGFGVGTSILKSNWSSSSPGAAAQINLDYDLNLFTSIGIQGTFGTLSGEDVENKLYFTKDAVTYAGGSLGFKVALGQFTDFNARGTLQESIKRLYFGAGIGAVLSTADLTPHSDGKGLSSLTVDNLAYGKLGASIKQKGSANPQHLQGADPYPFVPINLGTYIALRGLFGNDKIELNPNFQYNFVLSPLFDGYQPNSKDIAADPANSIFAHSASANQGFIVISIGLRYKF